MPKHGPEIRWKNLPDDEDLVAASEYLTLLTDDVTRNFYIAALKLERIETFYAKDILRASNLPGLPRNNTHVRKDLLRIEQDEKLSPILLVREGFRFQLIIADGYHRVSACYLVDENARVPCAVSW